MKIPTAPTHPISTYAAIAATHYGVELLDMIERNRTQPVAIARQVAIWLACEFGHHQRSHVAAWFGNRDVATICYALKAVRDGMETNARFRLVVDNLMLRHSLRHSLCRHGEEQGRCDSCDAPYASQTCDDDEQETEELQ